MRKVYLGALRPFVIQRSKYLVVSTTRGTANLLLHAVTGYSHADFATTKLVIIPWTGIDIISDEQITVSQSILGQIYADSK